MTTWKQQFAGFTAIIGVYLAILSLFFREAFSVYTAISFGLVYGLFALTSLMMSSETITDPQERIQKFMLGTTVQLLVAMFYVLFAKYLSPNHFREMSIHFLILFFLFLAVQATVLVKKVRG